MASSNMIVLNSKFNPFSYQELLAPVQSADIEHKLIEEEEGKLETLSNVWKNKLNPELDKKAYTQYTNYLDNLKKQSESLAKSGLTPGVRKGLISARAGYTSEIVPIETAYNTRLQRADEQRKLILSDPTYMHEKDLGNTSLDEFMTNPNLSARGISGSYFTKSVADAAEQMSKEMRSNPSKWTSILGGQAYQKLTQYGFTSDEVLKAIQGNPKAAPELTKLVKESVEASGIKDWNNEDVLKRAYGYANQGLYHAIGTSQEKEMANRNFLDPLQKAQLNAINPPTTPSRTWENVGDVVDATNSDFVKSATNNIAYLKTMQQQKDLSKWLTPVNKPANSYEASMGAPGNIVDNGKVYRELSKKYGTKNPSEIIKKIELEISKSTSLNRSTAIKLNENSVLNSFLSNQLLAGIPEDKIKTRITTIDGKEVPVEDIKTVFNGNGKFGYNAHTHELTMYNPDSKQQSFKINKGILTSIPLMLPSGQTISSRDYLEMIHKQYNNNPNSNVVSEMIDNFYNNLDVYGRTGLPAPSKTNSNSGLAN